MRRRQTIPRQWLIADARYRDELLAAAARLPRGSAVLLLRPLEPGEGRKLLQVARRRELHLVPAGAAARVHDLRELRQALLSRAPYILISPIHETRSHPGWQALPRMRAAALARLAGRRAVALGGMNDARFRKIERLGFAGWAGIDAWSELKARPRT